MAYTLGDKRQDCALAFQRSERYYRELREIYKLYMPWREPITERSAGGMGGQRTEGAPLWQDMYDSTAPAAAFSFAANTQADWFPAFDDFCKIEPGPLWDPSTREERTRDLQFVGEIVNALTQPVRATSQELFLDLFAGQAHMFVGQGPKARKPIRGLIVPPLEMATEDDADGETNRWYWRRKFKVRHLEEKFPNMRPGQTLANMLRSNRNDDVSVIQYTRYDADEDAYLYEAFLEAGDDSELAKERYRTAPWISPRIFKIPGESQGRGFAHIGMPGARSLNTARQLALRAAAFALLGLWTRRDDRVFNPKTAALAPGKMWKVGSNGGPMGPTIQRLDIPHNFDVSSIIIADERDQLRRILLDDELPEVADRVRSPTEIAGRMRRWDRNRGGSTVRLQQELIVPFVRRAVDICERHGFLPGQTDIDQILTKATLTAPAASAQHSGKVERVTAWLQIIVGLLGPQAMALSAEIEALIPQIGRWLGVEERFIRSKAQTQELQALVAKFVAQMQMEQQQAAAQPSPEASVPQVRPETLFMNGGGA